MEQRRVSLWEDERNALQAVEFECRVLGLIKAESCITCICVSHVISFGQLTCVPYPCLTLDHRVQNIQRT